MLSGDPQNSTQVLNSEFGIVAAFWQLELRVIGITTIVQVAFLLGIKFGMFPLLHDWWVDVCTVRMFGATIAQRVELENPFWISLIHWIDGIFYLLCVSIIVSLLQEVLYKGVLHFPSVHGNLIVFLVFLLIQLVMLLGHY